MRLNFEEIADEFQSHFRTRSISHCDFVEVVGDRVIMVEETRYIDKDLLERDVYDAEIIEMVKKMWGSFAIAVWRWSEKPEMLSKERYFILKVKVKPGFERTLAQLIKDVRKFKNGAYDDVKIKIAGDKDER